MEPSVGNKCDSNDNALAETMNGLCKADALSTRESVELAALAWVTCSAIAGCSYPSDTYCRQTTTGNLSVRRPW